MAKDQSLGSDWTEAMLRYYEYRRLAKCDSPAHLQAFMMYENSFEREVIEALLLAEADPEDVREVFGIPGNVLAIYKELFFDTERFMSRLSKISYVENYPDQFGRELKLRALHLGPDYVLFRLGNYIPKTEAQQNIVKRLFMSAAYRAMEANFNPIASQVTRAAIQHAQVMLKAYDCLKELMKEDPSQTREITQVLTLTDELKPSINNAPVNEKDII